MSEEGGFIVHFFDMGMVEHLAHAYAILAIDEFEEGGLPRKLFRVTLRKPESGLPQNEGTDRPYI